MKKNKIVSLKLVKGEKILYLIIIILTISVPLFSVITNALISESNIELEELNSKIDREYSSVESLNMQINELASLENIREIAKEYNLVYNNDAIKDIESE